MKKLLSLVLLLVLVLHVRAQQASTVYNQFFMNPYIYNPAYAGVEGHTVLFLMYKNQWTGIDGAPTLSHVNFHVPLKGGIAFGAMASNEKNGPFSTSYGKVSGGYLIAIDRSHFLRFGMSLGAGNTVFNHDIAKENPNDPNLNSIGNSSFLVGDLGMTYHFGHFNFGVSLPSLFERSLPSEAGLQPISFKPTDNILYKINYRGHINDNIAIEPHVLYRQYKYLPNQFEATMILHIYHLVWVGGTYRQNTGLVSLLGFKVKESLGVGYSYELGNSKYANQLGGSHEIHIGYHIGAKKHHAAHSSSFIKSHQHSAEDRAKKEELERQKKLQALKESRATAQIKEDENALTLVSKPVVKEEVKPKNTWNYEQEESLLERTNEFGEIEKGIKFDRIAANGEKEVVFSWLPPPPSGATSETYEIADPEQPPKERISANGTKEVGVKWIRTIDGGQKEVLVVWSPILNEAQASQIDHSPSKTLGVGAAKIVIKSTPVVPTPIQEPVVVQKKEEPVKTTPVVAKPVAKEPIIVKEPAIVKQEPKEEVVVIKPEPKKEVVVAKPTPVVSAPVTKPIEEPIPVSPTDKTQVKRREGHMLELPVGNYVIAGAFKNYDLAEEFSDKLFQRGFHDTRVGYISEHGLYYVTLSQSNDIKSANSQKSKVSGVSGLSQVWVLTVSE
jgi:type IX secretion system PorP/SprF family membrane protein